MVADVSRGLKKLTLMAEGVEEIFEAVRQINELGGLDRARQGIEAGMEDARLETERTQDALSEVQSALQVAEQNLAGAQDEAAEVRALARSDKDAMVEDGRKIRDELVDEGKAEVAKMKDEAEAEIEQAKLDSRELIDAHDAQVADLQAIERDLGEKIKEAQAKLDAINAEAAAVVRKFSR